MIFGKPAEPVCTVERAYGETIVSCELGDKKRLDIRINESSMCYVMFHGDKAVKTECKPIVNVYKTVPVRLYGI